MPLITKKNVLLTGAGFSANFGGLLSREMWSKILSNPKFDSIPKIREALKKDFDFESVYSSVKNSGEYSAEDKKIFQDIVEESYSSMDNALKLYSHHGFEKSGINTGNVTKWLGMFSGNSGEVGAHFTLNQDLLVERATGIIPLGLSVPSNRQYREDINLKQIDSSKTVTLPDTSLLEEFKTKHLPSNGTYCYIKLHGSLGWLSHDGHKQMILGTNKLEDIEKEPLLKWYFEVFKEAISAEGVKLFVAGYSFRDTHVNDLILRAIIDHKLEIYIISPEQPENFKDRANRGFTQNQGQIYQVSDNGVKIWDAVRAYFPYSLKEIFPAAGTDTATFLDIKKNMAKS